MSTTSHNSSAEYSLEPLPVGATPGKGVVMGQAGIWLDGNVLACACPDCGAPMSIRLWLMIADCFRCGASVELSEEQEQEALRLLREQEDAKQAESAEAVAAIAPTMLRKPRPKPAAPKPTEPAAQTTTAPTVPTRPATAPAEAPTPQAEPRPRRRRVAASEVHRGARAKVHEIYKKGGLAVWWADLFRDLPAWLVSLVVHLVALLLLALWIDEPTPEDLEITLATSVSYQDLEGEQGEIEETEIEAFEFDDPGAIELDNVVEETGAATEEMVDLEPVDEPVFMPEVVGDVPELALREQTAMPRTSAPLGRMLEGRNPEVRAQIVKREGGTSYTEAAVARGLKFLARHQQADGSWSLRNFHKTADCDETCKGPGSSQSDMAATALSLLPFLGAGQTHLEGEYTDEVLRALQWLAQQQRENGDLRSSGDGRMYAHGQATIALCEAYALTGDEQLREPAQLAINYIVRAQHSEGGWRYQPGERGDTSVVGWQLMALKSGQMAYLYVPSKTFEMAGLFLDQVQRDKLGGRYAYQPRGNPTDVMTAEALLCRQYLGWRKDNAGLRDGVKYLLEKHPPDVDKPNIYYWYYATQVMHHYGGPEWRRWNAKMREALVDTQATKGHAAGSWDPRGRGNSGGHADRGGRIFMTSLALCILEVYYRHMPIYGESVLDGFE